jgi:transposase
LLLADAGRKDKEIMTLLGVTRPTVSSMRKKYWEKGYKHIGDILPEAPRTGRPIEIDSRVAATISMIACSDPPAGCSRWTLHMIADRLVKLEVIDSISHESVRSVLKKTD